MTTKKRDVEYGLEVVDNLPPEVVKDRRSALRQNVEKVISDPELHRVPVKVGSYGDSAGAKAAAKILRYHYGNTPGVSGIAIAVRQIPTEDRTAPIRTGVYIAYNPDAIVMGEKDKHVEKLKEKAAASEKRKAAKVAEARKTVAAAKAS